MSPQYGELRPTSGWDLLANLGDPCNFNGFRVLAALLHGTLVVASAKLRRSTDGATYIRQCGHQVGHWPTFLVSNELMWFSQTTTVILYIWWEFCAEFCCFTIIYSMCICYVMWTSWTQFSSVKNATVLCVVLSYLMQVSVVLITNKCIYSFQLIIVLEIR